jgi:hypothetical protein
MSGGDLGGADHRYSAAPGVSAAKSKSAFDVAAQVGAKNRGVLQARLASFGSGASTARFVSMSNLKLTVALGLFFGRQEP